MVPPIAYTKVNASTPPVPDAGAMAQKSMSPLGAQALPKTAQAFFFEETMNMKSRPLVQDLVKQAMENAAQRAKIAAEGARQMKLAEGKCSKCDEDPCVCGKEEEKKGSARSVSTDYVFKLASAIEYAVPSVVAMAKSAAPNLPPPHFTEQILTSEPGVTMSNQKGSTPGPGQQGHGYHQPPMHPGSQKAMPQEHGANQLENTMEHPVMGEQTTAMSGGQGKTASLEMRNLALLSKLASGAPLPASFNISSLLGAGKKAVSSGAPSVLKAPVQGASMLGKGPITLSSFDKGASALLAYTKLAEDAINPAQIVAGPAIPPDSNMSGEPGGAPAGGMPQGPSSLIGSNEAAINYKKQTAYSPRKSELAQYFNEPALSAATDKTLNEAFAHTPEAGTKISSAQLLKSASARALLAKLAEEEKESMSAMQAAGRAVPAMVPRPGMTEVGRQSALKDFLAKQRATPTLAARMGGAGSAMKSLGQAAMSLKH
jgi:hypothetical protein